MNAGPRVHVVGAGLAGLAAAVRLADAGVAVTLHEAAGHAGGRCRSYHDEQLGRRIDNGNHLLLSGNHAALEFLASIGAGDTLTGPERAEFRFVDLEADIEWTLKPDRGAVPWSIFCPHRRVPGTRIGEYIGAWRLAWAGRTATVGQCLRTDGQLWRRFWRPLVVSILNTEPAEASAELLWAVMHETFGKGRAACRPLIAREGLSESFVEPALAHLARLGAEVRFNDRLREIVVADGWVSTLTFAEPVALGSADSVILAVPAAPAAKLLPVIGGPDQFQAIVNGHFVLPESAATSDFSGFVGIVGGTAEWLFRRGDVVSITVSAADALAAASDDEIAALLWADIRRILVLGDVPVGACRIIREKRATFAQTPAQVALRPPAVTACANLWLAGDWTDTGLPATIEGTIRSGRKAAELALNVHNIAP
ncbi:MAG: hydroxysqualene dehydroxylase HpnE [Rhodospirillaceae bacterium]